MLDFTTGALRRSSTAQKRGVNLVGFYLVPDGVHSDPEGKNAMIPRDDGAETPHRFSTKSELTMTRILGLMLLALPFVAQASAVPTPAVVAAPEIDPASTLSALTLLLGSLAVIRGRSRK